MHARARVLSIVQIYETQRASYSKGVALGEGMLEYRTKYPPPTHTSVDSATIAASYYIMEPVDKSLYRFFLAYVELASHVYAGFGHSPTKFNTKTSTRWTGGLQ
jgi:hypothetical protein